MKTDKARYANVSGFFRLITPKIFLLGAFCGVTAMAQSTSGGSNPSPGVMQNPYIQSAPSTNQTIIPPSAMGIAPPQDSSGGAGSGAGTAVFYPDIKEYVLNPGELINVRLYGAPDFLSTIRLSKDGTGSLPLIGSLHLAGITIQKAQDLIEDQLKSAGMYRNPSITITLAEANLESSVMLAGEMHARIPVRGERSLAEVLSSAGGLPLGASPVVSIVRPGVDEPIVVDLGTTAKDLAKANVPVRARDTIFIQRAGVVYVLGAFKTTGAIPLQPGRTTLMQIASLTGGPLYEAKYTDMRIVRTIGDQRTEVKVDIQKVIFGKAPDPIMQAGDIIFLPTSQLKAIISSGGIGTLLSVVNLALLVVTR